MPPTREGVSSTTFDTCRRMANRQAPLAGAIITSVYPLQARPSIGHPGQNESLAFPTAIRRRRHRYNRCQPLG